MMIKYFFTIVCRNKNLYYFCARFHCILSGWKYMEMYANIRFKILVLNSFVEMFVISTTPSIVRNSMNLRNTNGALIKIMHEALVSNH
jgi:hypothetical protein